MSGIGYTKTVIFEPLWSAPMCSILARIWRSYPLAGPVPDNRLAPGGLIGFLFSSLRRFGGHAQRGESARLGESDQSGST